MKGKRTDDRMTGSNILQGLTHAVSQMFAKQQHEAQNFPLIRRRPPLSPPLGHDKDQAVDE